MKKFIGEIIFLCAISLYGQAPTAETILDKIDQNMSSENRVLTSKMLIHGRRADRIIESKSWAMGTQKSFSEYLSPAREKGTKMLKLEDKLWMYSPGTDRIIQISGHMLRQSVMGSDLSYEDMMDDQTLQDNYDAVVSKSDTVEGRQCWVLELTAKTKNTAYFKRKIWVDKERFVPLKEDLFAKSGKLLKRLTLTDVVYLEGRWFPKRMIFKDMLKTGKGTEFIIEEIAFNQKISKNQFLKSSLRR